MVKVINSSGKHKTAIARATVTKGTGKVRINKIPTRVVYPGACKVEDLRTSDDRRRRSGLRA